MFRRKIFSIFLNAVIIQNSVSQVLPLTGGCGCQQMPVQQALASPFQVSNCGCRNNLLNLPNGIQLNNNLPLGQLAKNPCTNNLQLAMQNLMPIRNGLANGLQLANSLSQELLPLLNTPAPNCQNTLQMSLQALLNQLGQQPNCQCGCQSLALGNNLINNNLLGVNAMQKAISNLPGQSVANFQVVSGQQEVILGGNPCQSCQNIISNPCQSCQNVINPCACQSCQNIVSPCACQNIISPCQASQNIVTSPCQASQNVITSPCQASQNIVSNPCPCQSCQNPMQFTIYQ